MAWKSLADRLPTLPLVLAGPLLRRVEKDSVSVWVALKEARDLTLTVYSVDGLNTALMGASANTVSLGQHLHIVLLTAKIPAGQPPLAPEVTYSYNVTVTGTSTSILTNQGIADISYVKRGYVFPTFSLPPSSLNDLRIVHGSCRKLQAEGYDAFATVDSMINDEAYGTSLEWAKHRPHQLFLTGDQIYADDVAGLQLYLIQDARDALLGWSETISHPLGSTTPTDSRAAVGQRADMIVKQSGFKFEGEEEIPQNHLMFLGEYYCMYLFMWSPVLWPSAADYPTFAQVYPPDREKKPTPREFAAEVTAAQNLQADLPAVRRALANVPTYMICDDHEITDDWFITMEWTNDVIGSSMGKRIVQNGLTAYALFQAWGNTPERFTGTEPGKLLLNIMPQWANYEAQDAVTPFTPAYTSYFDSIYGLLGLPDYAQSQTQRQLVPVNLDRLTYHYHIDWGLHEVFVLDTRTQRAFPPDDKGSPLLIATDKLDGQIGAFSTTAEVTFLVIATPVSGVPNIETSLEWVAWLNDIYFADGETYSGQRSAVEELYATLAKRAASQRASTGRISPARLVALSGDVHYAFTNRLEYWGSRTFRDTSQTPALAQEAHFVLAQLCASALKNEKGVINDYHKYGLVRTGTNAGHMGGYNNEELYRGTMRIGWVPSAAPIIAVAHWGNSFSDKIYLTNDECTLVDLQKRTEPTDSDWPHMLIQPDWRYRINYLTALAGTTRPYTTPPVVAQDPGAAAPNSELRCYLDIARNYKKYETFFQGRHIVGKNNIGEVRFSWGATEATKKLIHQLWWRMASALYQDLELPTFPLSEFEVIMGEDNQKYPKLTFIQD